MRLPPALPQGHGAVPDGGAADLRRGGKPQHGLLALVTVMTPVIEARRLSKHFPVKRGLFSQTIGHVSAVDDVSFIIAPGTTLGVVGESGCGKTTTAKLVLRLEDPTAGELLFEGRDLQSMDADGIRAYRRSVQAVFQDPFASLNPRMRVGSIIAEPLVTNERRTGAEVQERISE